MEQTVLLVPKGQQAPQDVAKHLEHLAQMVLLVPMELMAQVVKVELQVQVEQMVQVVLQVHQVHRELQV